MYPAAHGGLDHEQAPPAPLPRQGQCADAAPERAFFRITVVIQERHPTQRKAAAILGIDRPKVSAITRGRLREFSLDRLLTFLGRLGMDVQIVVSANREAERAPRLVVRTTDEAAAVCR